MATVTITIPDSELTRVTTALCQSAGLPVSAANAKNVVIGAIKNVVFSQERQATEAAAKATYLAAIAAQPSDPGLG